MQYDTHNKTFLSGTVSLQPLTLSWNYLLPIWPVTQGQACVSSETTKCCKNPAYRDGYKFKHQHIANYCGSLLINTFLTYEFQHCKKGRMLHEGKTLSDAADFCYTQKAWVACKGILYCKIRFTQDTEVPWFAFKRILSLRIITFS